MLRTSALLMAQPKASHATDFSQHSFNDEETERRLLMGQGMGDGMDWDGETTAEPKIVGSVSRQVGKATDSERRLATG